MSAEEVAPFNTKFQAPECRIRRLTVMSSTFSEGMQNKSPNSAVNGKIKWGTRMFHTCSDGDEVGERQVGCFIPVANEKIL